MDELPWRVRAYIASVALVAAALLARGPFSGIPWAAVAILGLLLAVCESATTVLRSRDVFWSANSAPILAAMVLTGPVGAGLVGAFTLIGLRRTTSVPKRAFNAGMLALAGYLPGKVFLLLGGHVHTPTLNSFPGIIGPFAVAAFAHMVVNYLLLCGVLWMTSEVGQVGQATRNLLDPRVLLTDLGYCTYGLLIAALWSVVGPFAPVLMLIPLFVARWAMAQFTAQQRAYEATVSALCQAVETKDFYTRGHSERVSRGSVMIARQVAMRGERVEALRYAGMLHDVGKLGVPTQVLQKTGKLTDEEYAAIQLHPMRGLDIVRDIGFLDEALAGIMHHHERIDGRGYPMGLAGDEIPEFARVLAVADAFDAMTSTRSYRDARPIPEAVGELRRWAGTQFDPAFVDAFIAALAREGWSRSRPPVPLPEEESAAGDDEPTAPLRAIESY